MLKKYLWTLVTLGLLVIGGCQASEAPTNPNYKSTPKTDAVDKSVVNQAIPSSKGPTEPPSSRGPTAAQAQAITQNENIRLSLPLKVDKSE